MPLLTLTAEVLGVLMLPPLLLGPAKRDDGIDEEVEGLAPEIAGCRWRPVCRLESAVFGLLAACSGRSAGPTREKFIPLGGSGPKGDAAEAADEGEAGYPRGARPLVWMGAAVAPPRKLELVGP